MPTKWIIDGVMRPEGATAHLNGGIFDTPCGGHAPEKGKAARPSVWILDARGLEKTERLTVFVSVKNQGECPFAILLLTPAGKTVVERVVDPGTESGMIVANGVGTIQIHCRGTDADGRCKGEYDVWIG